MGQNWVPQQLDSKICKICGPQQVLKCDPYPKHMCIQTIKIDVASVYM